MHTQICDTILSKRPTAEIVALTLLKPFQTVLESPKALHL